MQMSKIVNIDVSKDPHTTWTRKVQYLKRLALSEAFVVNLIVGGVKGSAQIQ